MSWKVKLKIKHLFTSENDAVSVCESCHAVAKVMRKELSSFIQAGHWNLEDVIERMESFHPDDEAEFDVSLLDEANGCLNEIYDWADENRVWIE